MQEGRFLTREELLKLINEQVGPLGKSTLDKECMPSKGGGPPVAAYCRGRRYPRPLYELTAGLNWARSFLLTLPA